MIIDDGPEQIVNPATGLSDMYIGIADGSHRIQFRLYDGSLQRGRSVPAQETAMGRAVISTLSAHGDDDMKHRRC